MTVARNYPRFADVVIKRLHGDYPRNIAGEIFFGSSADHIVQGLREAVARHNQTYDVGKDRFVLLPPNAYPISGKFVAMARTNAPSVEEILHPRNRTERGRLLWRRLADRHRLELRDLVQATKLVGGRTGITRQNLLFLGYRKGKFVFMPLVDTS